MTTSRVIYFDRLKPNYSTTFRVENYILGLSVPINQLMMFLRAQDRSLNMM